MPLIYEGCIRYSAGARIAAFVVLSLREMGGGFKNQSLSKQIQWHLQDSRELILNEITVVDLLSIFFQHGGTRSFSLVFLCELHVASVALTAGFVIFMS